MSQRNENPYEYSDTNKRYMTYDWYMKRRFGGKVAKVSLDAGFTCPNIDGALGRGGCIYCKNGASSSVGKTLAEQYENGIRVACRKWSPVGFIPYLQSHTNTYGDAGFLRKIYSGAAALPGAVMLDISTRADCLPDDVIGVLCEIAEQIPLTVELGLQSSSDETAHLINRRHKYAAFCDGYNRLTCAFQEINSAYPPTPQVCEPGIKGTSLPMKRATVGVHIINGLPGESRREMLKTAADVAALRPDMVKIHLMHVLRGTPLADMYARGKYVPLDLPDYVSVTCDQLELLPAETMIGRITGDGVADDLIAPQWSRRKTAVANEIDKELYRRRGMQGDSGETRFLTERKIPLQESRKDF